MDNSWNMVGLVGWWRRMEKENERQKKQGKKKQEKEASISFDQEEPNQHKTLLCKDVFSLTQRTSLNRT